jgi:hypothetical protein
VGVAWGAGARATLPALHAALRLPPATHTTPHHTTPHLTSPHHTTPHHTQCALCSAQQTHSRRHAQTTPWQRCTGCTGSNPAAYEQAGAPVPPPDCPPAPRTVCTLRPRCALGQSCRLVCCPPPTTTTTTTGMSGITHKRPTRSANHTHPRYRIAQHEESQHRGEAGTAGAGKGAQFQTRGREHACLCGRL